MDFKLGVLLIFVAYICTTNALEPCECPRIFLPVCGSDGEFYSNSCRLECASYRTGKKITVAKYGPCEEPLPQGVRNQCECNDENAPVCGSDGRTYSNECRLNCQKTEDFTLKLDRSGPC